ncbi:MAG: YbjN domain-containing protein [Anaerolineales bacterium]
MTTSPADSNPQPEPLNENSLLAFDVLGQYLEEDGWYPKRAEGKYGYWMTYRGNSGDFRCYASILMARERLLFYAITPVRAPEEVRMAVAEFMTRANYNMQMGNFELDFSDGEMRYKSSLDFEKCTLTPQWIRNTIYPATSTLDRYLPGLMKVIYGGATPFEAIQEIEG